MIGNYDIGKATGVVYVVGTIAHQKVASRCPTP